MSRIQIIRKLLEGNEHLLQFLFVNHPGEVTDQNGVMDVEYLKKEMGVFSGGEQIMIKVAMDIWGEYGKVEIFDICRRLDESNFIKAITALIEFRKL